MNPRAAFIGLTSLVLLAASAPLFAQRMELADHTAQPVVVETASISTEIAGRIAVTTFDLVFRNPNARVLEGTFSFPLLDGQNVVRFALDLNGRLREAVPVDKTHGRVVFEEIERRRVDPGLLEQTAGNNYRARIFPIPAHGTRHLVLAYQEEIPREATGAHYRLALDFPEKLARFRLALNAYSADAIPAKVRTTLDCAVPAWRPGHALEIEQRDFTARGLLELELPPLTQPSLITGFHDNDEYFQAEVPIAVAPQPRAAPRVIGLVWDSSGSGHERDHARELALLDAWFAHVRDVEVRLIRLRDQMEAAATFAVKAGDWTALKQELEKTIYDGASSLDGWNDDRAVDEWLLFSDGLINYGTTPLHQKLKLHGAVHAILASARADATWLRALAMRQGGEFVDLLRTAAATGAGTLRTKSVRVLEIDYNHAELADVFPEPGAVVVDNAVVVSGLIRSSRTLLQLSVGTSERDARTIDVPIESGVNRTALAARAWGTAKINQLALDRPANREDIRRTSREFGIVTPDTSLIVLETAADYARYEITPPDELRREWSALRRGVAGDQRKDRDEHLEGVVRDFQERVRWWEKTFPHDAPPPAAMYDRKAQAFAPPASINAPPPARQFRESREAPTVTGDDIVRLDAFEVTASAERGYAAASTLSGSRVAGAVSSGQRATVDAATEAPAGPTITLQRWTPNAGYLERLRRVPALRAYGIYLEERGRHDREPGFFLDVANFFFEHEQADLARRILSNLAELELEDVALLRVLAHRLVQAERPDLARPLFERVLALRSDEPQSRRDLALTCAELKQFQRAIDLLWEVVSRPWDRRFGGIELIALGELNAIAATCGQDVNLSRIDRRLRRNLPVETRVVLTWDANDCDIDLWVTDPNGERAAYNNPLTYQGGRMSADFTAGYGPEEFLLRAPKVGSYQVHIDYFGDSRMTALGPVTAQIRLITGFGTRAQREKRITVRLDQRKENREVGTFEVGATAKNTTAYLTR